MKMLRMLLLIANKVGADLHEDPDMEGLQQPTHPEKLDAQIDQALKDKESKQ